MLDSLMDQFQQRWSLKNIKMKNKINLKQTFEKLEKILAQLESADLDIDEMVKLYGEGMQLSKHCKDVIEQAEQRIEVINMSLKEES